jgi:hypothetical protein
LRQALTLARLSRELLPKQVLLAKPERLVWQPVQWLAWLQPAFSLQVWPLVLQQPVWRQLAWQRLAWRQRLVSLQLVLRLV